MPITATIEHPTDRDRRETERAVAYWEDKVSELGNDATVATLDLAAINSPDWSNRFLITVDQNIERSTLLLCGSKFARLLDLPPKTRSDLPLLRQLPRRYSEVFLRGCAETVAPLHLEGEVERYADRIERYRAVFIPVRVKPNSLTHFAFGAFNCCVAERAIAT